MLKRLRILFDRRVRYRITGGGAVFLLVLMMTGTGAFLSANNLLFLVFSAMLAMLLVSGFLSRLVLSGLEIELSLPEHVCARAETQARIRIRNMKRLTPSFSIRMTGRESGAAKMPPIFSGSVYFPLIPGGGIVESDILVMFPFRGRHRESLFALSTRFPFGFIRKTATVMLRRETVVYPALEPRGAMELLLEEMGADNQAQRRGSGLDFYRIRPYESTDGARLVDWKSTAHTGSLQVREFSREERSAVEIYFDRRVAEGQYEWFEKAVESCAFLMWNLFERGGELHLEAQGFSFSVPDDGDIYACLRYLALVEPIASRAAAPEMAKSGAGPCIVFSAQPEEFEDSGWVSASVS